MKLTHSVLSAVAAVVAVPAFAQAALILDDFNQSTAAWPLVCPAAGGPVSVTDTGNAPGVLTGARAVRVTGAVVANPGFFPMAAAVSNGILEFVSPTERKGALELTYNTGLIPNLQSIVVSGVEYDAPLNGPMPVSVTLHTPGGDYVQFVNAVAGGPQTLNFDLSSLAPAALTSFTAITVSFDPLKGGDFRVDEISYTLVPEPASLSLLGLGAIALVSRRNRRR